MTSGARAGLLVLLAVSLIASSARADDDAFRWFPPRAQGLGVIFVPKLHYSADNDFGVGLEAVRPYRFPGSSDVALDSEFRVNSRLNTDGHGKAELEGTAYFGAGDWSARAKISYDTLALRFWGIGADTASEDEEVYRPQSVLAYAELFRQVLPHLRVGLRAEVQDYRYLEVESGGLLDTVDYLGRRQDNVAGGGFVWEWDTRDDRYAPTRGWYAQGFGLFFDRGRGDFAFNNWHADIRHYRQLSEKDVIALQAFAFGLWGDAPIWRYAAVGGRPHSRGYRRGRFLERRMFAVQAEWRRPLVGRFDGVAFGGLANVASSYERFKLERMRPTLGVGLRLRVKEERGLLIRADLAFGGSSMRAYLKFGHAF